MNTYIKIKDDEVVDTKDLKDSGGKSTGIAFDKNREGEIIGIEVLDAKSVTTSEN